MKYPKPEHVINTVYYDQTGAYRYRASHAILKRMHHKLVPVYKREDGGINLVFSKYIVPLVLYQPFLDVVAHIPPDAPIVYMPDLDENGRLALSYLEGLQRVKSKEEEEGFKGQLYWTIGEYYKLIPDTAKIADMFMVGDHLVNSALKVRKLGIHAPEYKTPAKPPAKVRLEQELAELKKDPRYKAVTKQVAKARSTYSTMGVSMRLSYLDVFPKYMGEPYIPKVCPVLKIELSYNVDAKNKPLNQVAIGRRNRRLSVEADNVLIMSYLARKLIEGTATPNYAEQALTSLNAHEAWAQWKASNE